MLTWLSQEIVARILFNFYRQIGIEVTYEQVLQNLLEKCDSGEIPCISIPPHMEDKAKLN